MKGYLSVVLLAGCLLVAAFTPFTGGEGQKGFLSPGQSPRPKQQQTTLPVFRLTHPSVSQGTLQDLERLLPGLAADTIFSDTTFAGSLRFTSLNSQTGASVEQFATSGGFFAVNFRRAFSETPALLDYGPGFVCNLLLDKGLFPRSVTPPENLDCEGGALPYEETPIYLSIVTPTVAVAAGSSPDLTEAISQVTQIGVVYQVPLAVDVGDSTPNYIPLTGPGGHLSLLFTGFGDSESLDPQYPGLNAIASPFYGRQFQKIGDYPTVSEQEAITQLRDGLPPGAVITPGNPGLAYYVDHPAITQTAMMPVWVFSEVLVNVGGQEFPLKSLMVPAVDGFLPEVRIDSPGDNTRYIPGQPLTVKGNISGSAGPFSYTLSVEGGELLKAGVTPGGSVQFDLTSVPLLLDKMSGNNIVLRLSATDGNGATSEDTVMLLEPRRAYLPMIGRNLNGVAIGSKYEDDLPPPKVSQVVPELTLGVEWIHYYNGHGANLPGVPWDANGFYNKLKSFGWTDGYNYGNDEAWEKDWRDCLLGGIDCWLGVDTVKYAYFSGHGGPAHISFGTKMDDYAFFAGNARFQNVRWVSFSSCQTLRAGPYVGPGNPPLTHWFNAFQGAYMLMGFHSNMADAAFGGPLADNMRLPMIFGQPLYSAQRSIREAWVLTAFQLNVGKPAYLYPVGAFNPVDYKLPISFWHNYFTLPLLNIYEYRWVWWE